MQCSDQQEITALREEVDSLTSQMADLQHDVQGSREREAELLGFTEKLSSKNAQLQSESNTLQAQLDQLNSSFTELRALQEETSRQLEDKVGKLNEKDTMRGFCLTTPRSLEIIKMLYYEVTLSCISQTRQLKQEEFSRQQEVQALQEERTALQTEVAKLKTRVEELRDELMTQKRKQAANIKDLTKQLTQG